MLNMQSQLFQNALCRFASVQSFFVLGCSEVVVSWTLDDVRGIWGLAEARAFRLH